MNFDFVDRVLAGAVGRLPTVAPRPVTEFEPLPTDPAADDGIVEVHEETIAPRPDGRARSREPQAFSTRPNREIASEARQEQGRLDAPLEMSESDRPRIGDRDVAEPAAQPKLTESPREKSFPAVTKESGSGEAVSGEPTTRIDRLERVVEHIESASPREFLESEGKSEPQPHVVEIVREPMVVEVTADEPAGRVQDRIREVTRTLREVREEHITDREELFTEVTEVRQEKAVTERRVLEERETVIPSVLERMVAAETVQQFAPTVEVNIGRVEIHAAPPKAPNVRPASARQAPSSPSLDDFLQKRGRDR